jgi:hypothetical protein
MSAVTASTKPLTTPQLFRTLKADNVDAKDALALAANSAQKRWPMLQSTRPEKWLPTPKLTEGEKQDRRNADVVRTVARPAASPLLAVPSIDSRIASGLSRMLFQKLKSTVVAASSPAPSQPLKPIQATTSNVQQIVYQAAPVELESPAEPLHADDSIQSVLQRLEKHPAQLSTVAQRQPSFLSRLGKR